MVASRIYFSPSPCYRPRLCVHPMATSTPPTHPKTLIYLLDVSPSTTAFDPSAFISPPDERKFSAFTIPSAIVSLSSHSTEPDQIPPERSTQGEMSIFLLISLVRSVDRVLLISNVTFPLPLLFYIHRVWETHSGLKHSDERWFRCTREQREETGRNGVGVRSLSPSLLLPS